MCQCDARVRTPFCGKPGCEWPEEKRLKLSLSEPEIQTLKDVLSFALATCPDDRFDEFRRLRSKLLLPIENKNIR